MKTAGTVVCEAGYLAVSLDENAAGYRLLETKADLYNFFTECERIFTDVPIGLQDDKEVRECDKLLREKLGSDYEASVIDPPIRDAVLAPTYGEASMVSYEKMGKRMPMQSWSIKPDIRVFDDFLQKNEDYRDKILSSHTELLFQLLNGGNTILQKKETKKGLRHRLHLLEDENKYVEKFFRDIKEEFRRNQVEETKIIDVLVLALSARRSSEEPVKTLPETPPVDSTGLPKAVYYV